MESRRRLNLCFSVDPMLEPNNKSVETRGKFFTSGKRGLWKWRRGGSFRHDIQSADVDHEVHCSSDCIFAWGLIFLYCITRYPQAWLGMACLLWSWSVYMFICLFLRELMRPYRGATIPTGCPLTPTNSKHAYLTYRFSLSFFFRAWLMGTADTETLDR